jgi:hypothetical protein
VEVEAARAQCEEKIAALAAAVSAFELERCRAAAALAARSAAPLPALPVPCAATPPVRAPGGLRAGFLNF